MAPLAILCCYFVLKDGVTSDFHGTATTKAGTFIALSEALHVSPLFNHASKPNWIRKA
jgi:hypothetical protein